MSRLLVLQALEGLSLDLQKRIFTAIFPTRQQIESRLQDQHPTLQEFFELDAQIIDFVHHGEGYQEFPVLSRTERKWLHLRSEGLQILHESFETENGRVLVIAKGLGWFYNEDADVEPFRWGKATWQGEILVCENCGRSKAPHIAGQNFCFECMEEFQL